ncbi:protein farnesyltransferase subunit beta [Marchantia polymorpha subsp. ruderalis]|uniref:Protein farnesyltransferase subunit beta n=2 Tax=Marchantia polymorpha TaxID=3197 RepID=A0AAF6C0D3_MARPO|nr:hypothetical protein MARPO_0123s0027 [Marchantia polymorpha]BBN17717.1 hypothetical protein Mp_7g16450 [Marchantia polymorpha subsp. ruderalis]|eukprot:PTQ30540.1 hypothetical protein MARPO_0123s0027 [Marchantia polymorpha]
MEEASSSCTVTQRLQADLERVVGSLYADFGSAASKERTELLTLYTDHHETYVTRGLRRLSAGFYVLDSSRPWLCYWILHSLALLGRPVDGALYNRSVSFLKHCQDPEGGYGGGPGQMPHLATTYAAVCALVTLGGEKALASINREKTLQFLLRMKDPCGGFRVHDDGEMDMRGSYTALAVAHLLDIMVPELVVNVGEFVRSCQTYEGGIGGEPGAEAHGGYTFCGLAALALVNQLHVLDLPGLVNWVAFRQGRVEGGFQGRTNKLVDGCYSFWQGGCFQVLQQYMPHLWAQQNTSMAALNKLSDLSEQINPESEDVANAMQVDSREKEDEAASVRPEEKPLPSTRSGLDTVINLNPLTEALDETQLTLKSSKETHGVGEPVPSTAGDSLSAVTADKMIVDDGEEFRSPSRQSPTSKEWNGDDEGCVFWDSDSLRGFTSADKLFPMVEIGFHREPQSVRCVEVVEAPQAVAQDSGAGTTESSSNSSRSTVELDSIDECLYGPIFNSQALQAYILLCCQDLYGGLRDKPGKSCDYYHACYCLSGLSAAQYSTAHRVGGPPPPSGVLGPYSNLLEATHALCNVRLDRYYGARKFFQSS